MSYEIIGPRKIDYYIFNPTAVIIDIRDMKDYLRQRIRNSINYPNQELLKDINRFKELHNSYKNDRFMKIFNDFNKIYVFYCDKGMASLVICEELSKLGFICKSLVGGFDGYKNSRTGHLNII